jgi:Tfp pilus assembly protein PilX
MVYNLSKMVMNTHRKKTVRNDERGFASLVIALVLIVVLGLLTVGFAQLARREQQNSLDKQLASQAYDAAESGVNDAYHDITTVDPASTVSPGPLCPAPENTYYINPCNVPVSPDTCLTTTNMPSLSDSGADSGNQTINQTNGVSYTCLMVNLTPPNLVYNNVAPDTYVNTVFTTTNNGGGTLKDLVFQWTSGDGKTAIPASSDNLTPDSNWNSPAILEVSITPLPSSGFLDRTSLINSTFTTFLYPANADAGFSYQPNGTDPGAQGQIQNSNCSATPGTCTATVTGLNFLGAKPGESFLLHILDYYDESQNITVNASDQSGSSLNFTGQDQIDVTGKARNVLKRIQEVVQPNGMSDLPSFALEGQNICKRFSTDPSITTPDTSVPGLSTCDSFQ